MFPLFANIVHQTDQILPIQARVPCGAMDWDPIYDGAVKRPQYGERQTNSGGVRPKQRFNWKQRLIAFAHILEPSHLSFLNDVNLRQRRELSIHLSHSRLLSTLSSNMLSSFFINLNICLELFSNFPQICAVVSSNAWKYNFAPNSCLNLHLRILRLEKLMPWR